MSQELAGVHFSTASRALDPQKRQMVGEAVIARVVAAATSLRYQRNEAAVGLKTRKSFLINILLPNLGHNACAPIVSGVRERLVSTHYVAIVGDEKRLVGQERFSLQAMKMRPIGGLIVATAELRDRFIEEAAVEQLPLVQILRSDKKRSSSTVLVDLNAFMKSAVSLLRAHGHSRIGLVSHPQTLSSGVSELAGFKQAMRAAGLKIQENQVEVAVEDTIEAGHRAFLQLKSQNQALSAIIACDDRTAIGCIDGAQALGLSCPDQISVIGFGDFPLVDRLSPPLTTMRVDYARIGRIAADLMISSH